MDASAYGDKLDNLDLDTLLDECINLLTNPKQVEWRSTAPANDSDREPNRIYLSYPVYPEQLRQLIWVLHYQDGFKVLNLKGIAIDELSEDEIGSCIRSM